MQNENVQQLGLQLGRHWFKIGIVALLLYVVFNRDLSFNVRLRTPETEEEGPAQAPSKKARQKELYTETAPAGEPYSTQRMDFSGLGVSAGKDAPVLLEKLRQLDGPVVDAFIRRFSNVAQTEQEKFGIPASVTLASAMLHSLAGTRQPAQTSQNFFTLTCTGDWQGETADYDGTCLRQYGNAWMSFRDHSLYVTSGAFAPLKQLGPEDYKPWAKSLESKGFLGEKGLARQLIETIEVYELSRFDE
jgi:flagellum-specific peptidoglycan hydrolase FlgJ